MLRAVPLVLFLALLPGCAGDEGRPAAGEPGGRSSPAAQPASAPVQVPSPSPADEAPAPVSEEPGRAAPERNVVITLPKEGQTITSNPIRVEGRARTFENHVEIRVDDQHGQPIVMSYSTARGEMGQFNPFSDEIFLTADPGSEITITAIERSAEDGSVRTSHSVRVEVSGRKAPVRLYFPNSTGGGNDCTVVERVIRSVPVSVSTARLGLEALLRGPIQPEAVAGFTNPFPKGAALRSVNLRNGTLTADFNEAMGNVGGSCRVQSIRASIEKTMTSIPGVKRVVITTMGDEKTALQP